MSDSLGFGGHRPWDGEIGATHANGKGQSASGLDLPVVRHELKNGLKLLILPRGGSPIATFYTQFNIGSVHEEAGLTGVSHLLEHMLKKGTQEVGTADWEREQAYFPKIDAAAEALHDFRRSEQAGDADEERRLTEAIRAVEDEARAHIVAEEYDLILKRNGARQRNATTSADRTNFFVSLPVERAEVWFALEGDRLRNLVFRDFYRERDVVMEERRRNYETQPWGILREKLFWNAFSEHPYRNPTIGHMDDLLLMDRLAVEGHFHRYYGARNCITVVVGCVDVDRIIALAEHYLGGVPPGEPIPAVDIVEPAQKAEKRLHITYDAEPHLMVAYHVPEVEHEDGPALAVLSSVLTEGRSSRLYKRAVLEEQVATDIACSMGPGQVYNRLFVFSAIPRRPHSAEDVEALILDEVEKLISTPLVDGEVERVLGRREAHEVRRLQSNLGLAWQLGISEGLWGDWRWTFQYGERLAQVTPEKIQEVARRYFRAENRTVAILDRRESGDS